MNTRQYNHGFTLLELIIFMGLFSTVLVVLTSLFGATMEQQLSTQGMSATESDASYILGRLQYDIDRADSINVPFAFGETSDELTLQSGSDTFTYQASGGTLFLDYPGGVSALTSVRTRVANISFLKIGNVGGTPTVKISIELESIAETDAGPETSFINTTIGLN